MNLHLVRVERHRLGLRLFVFGRRIHEWHLGLLLLGSAALLGSLDRIGFTVAVVLVSVGIWLIAKDWRDLTRSRRDTAAWRLGMHRRPSPLRPWRQLDDVPTAAAVGVAAVGTIDLVSAVTPNVSWRDHLLLHVEPVAAMQTAHVLAVPVSFGLLVTAYFLFRRRSRAVYVALAFMAFLAVSNLIKGLDIEEAALTIAAATLLWSARSSFHVRHEPTTLRAALWQLPLLAAAVLSASLAVVTIAAPAGTSSSAVVGATLDLLLWQPAPFAFHDELAGTGTAVGLGGLLVVICAAYLVFRPLAAPRDLPDAELRHAAVDLVRTHGADTLSFFKLRMDAHYLFSAQRTAFIGYRVEGRVLLISGDPVGEPDAIDEVIRTAVRFAEERGLKLAAIGVSPAGRAALEQAGLRALYIGDEAIVDTEHFTLEGRAIRKVRQSVSRLKNAGYHTAATELGTLDTHTVDRLEQIAQEWRHGAPERGFSMAMDSLRNPYSSNTLIVYAADASDRIRGFLQFVPTFGRTAASLSMMRREKDTPNGLTEFLIVEAIEHLRARGVTEASLNFAAFGRLIREPKGAAERAAGRALTVADTWFQIERLYRFNAKFFPRWEPRYFMYEGRLGIPRAAIAALSVEGQLPKARPRPQPVAGG